MRASVQIFRTRERCAAVCIANHAGDYFPVRCTACRRPIVLHGAKFLIFHVSCRVKANGVAVALRKRRKKGQQPRSKQRTKDRQSGGGGGGVAKSSSFKPQPTKPGDAGRVLPVCIANCAAVVTMVCCPASNHQLVGPHFILRRSRHSRNVKKI